MAFPILKKDMRIGIEEEVTEGVYLAPQSTTSYVRVLEDGATISPERELLERSLITGDLGNLAPKKGMKSVTGGINVEASGSGVEGGEPDHHLLLKSALGSTGSIATSSTSKAGNTATQIEIEDADIAKYAVNDVVLVKEAGAYEVRPISVVETGAGVANIQFPFALDNGAPSDAVVVAPATQYRTVNSGHPSLSVSQYLGNEKRYAAIGSKVASFSLENFTAGQIGNLNFGLEGLTYTLVDGIAPQTPAFDSSTPICALQAFVYRGGVGFQVNAFSLSLANSLSNVTDLTDANGKVASHVTSREISGTINPYMDDTTVARFDAWNDGTEFSIFMYGYVPSAVAGEFAAGSVMGFWLPQCVFTEAAPGDLEEMHIDELSFRSVVDASGVNDELYIGVI